LAVDVVHSCVVPAMITEHVKPALQNPSVQHGWPPSPQRVQPPCRSARVMQTSPALQFPPQHGCASPPHGTQFPDEHKPPGSQAVPLQHG
jgi:hypothetical protein